MSRKASKVIKAWGGFSGDCLHNWQASDGYSEPAIQWAIYTTRKGARARYEDVRRITITVDTP